MLIYIKIFKTTFDTDAELFWLVLIPNRVFGTLVFVPNTNTVTEVIEISISKRENSRMN